MYFFIVHLLIGVHAADTPPTCQSKLLSLLFDELSSGFITTASNGTCREKSSCAFDVCGYPSHRSWNGILCEKGKVTQIHYYNTIEGEFHLKFIPPTVELLSIMFCAQMNPIETQLLPRELRDFNMGINHISGTIALQYLQQKLRLL